MKTLNLNLKRKWFDMILSGEKLEEYREIKPYWCSYLLLYKGERKNSRWWNLYLNQKDDIAATRGLAIIEDIIFGYIAITPYDSIEFANGFSSDRDKFKAEFNDIDIRTGNTEWGALQGVDYFVLKFTNVTKINESSQSMKAYVIGCDGLNDYIAAPSKRKAINVYHDIHKFDEDTFFEDINIERMTDEQLDNPFTMEGEQFTYRMILESCVEADILGNNYES